MNKVINAMKTSRKYERNKGKNASEDKNWSLQKYIYSYQYLLEKRKSSSQRAVRKEAFRRATGPK